MIKFHSMLLICYIVICCFLKVSNSLLQDYQHKLCQLEGDLQNQYPSILNLIHQYNNDLMVSFQSIYGPKPPMIGVVSYLTSDILSYASYSLSINFFYAIKHQYFYYILDSNTEHYNIDYDTNDVRWNKVIILQKGLESFAQTLDYLLWVDADLIFLNHSRSLEEILYQYPNAYFIASAELAGSTTLINSGAVMIRNTLWSQRFLSLWWTYQSRQFYSDQEQFDLLYSYLSSEPQQQLQSSSFAKNLTNKIIILPPEILNSDPPAMTKQTIGSPILHLMGEEDEFRRLMFSKGYSFLCSLCHNNSHNTNHHNKNEKLQLQDMLSQPQLLFHSIIHYSTILSIKLSYYYKNLHPISVEELHHNDLTLQGSVLFTLTEMKQLSNIAHHYCHAWEHKYLLPEKMMINLTLIPQTIQKDNNNSIVLSNTTLIRIEIFNIILQNVHNIQQILPTLSTTWKDDYPEMIKTLIIASQHIIQNQYLSYEYRHQRIQQTIDLLQELLSISHSQQHNAIYQMIAQVYQDCALLYIDQYMKQLALINSISNDSLANIASDQISPTNMPETISYDLLALEEINKSVDILETISVTFGSHLLIPSYSIAANIYAMLNNYSQSFLYSEKSILWTQHIYGPYHVSLIQLYYNYAVSLSKIGEKESSLEILNKKLFQVYQKNDFQFVSKNQNQNNSDQDVLSFVDIQSCIFPFPFLEETQSHLTICLNAIQLSYQLLNINIFEI